MQRLLAFVLVAMFAFGCASKPQLSRIEFLKKQAKKGDALAQLRLGDLYLTGQGVETDGSTAVKWIRKAALQDQPDALILLGDLYMRGQAVEKDQSSIHNSRS